MNQYSVGYAAANWTRLAIADISADIAMLNLRRQM